MVKICMAVTNEVSNDPRVQKEAETLGKRYDVTVVGFQRNGKPAEESRAFYKIIRVKEPLLRRIFHKNKSVVSFVSSESSFIQESVADAIQLGFFYAREKAIYRGMKKIRADIYHANDLDTLRPCIWTAKKHGGKVIYDSHELFVEDGFIRRQSIKNVLFRIEKKAIRKASRVITVNEFIAEELRKRYDLDIVPDIILNLPPYEKHEFRKTDRKKPVMVFQGFLAPGRGQEEMVQAMEYVKRPAELRILGFGPLLDNLKQYVEQHGLADRVKFIPKLPSDEVVRECAKADIGFVPMKPTCLNNFYSSPNKLFQSMASGLCIFAFDIPFYRRYVQELGTGLVYRDHDPEQIAGILDSLLSEPGRIDRFKKESLEQAKSLNWESQEKDIFSIYEAVISGN
jgi:glycosyltransferase involved in cell wall biosynthesis